MGITRGKVWGNTSMIFHENNVEMSRIEVKKGGYCSKHKHQHKFNLFFIEKGILKITVYRQDAGQTMEDITILKDRDSTYVEPSLFHCFEALEDTVAYEIYWTELDVNDIERETVGGIKSSDTL